jgi:hypothetical protein
MTLPTTCSWFLSGARLRVPYEASQGRRVNALGALFTHGPLAGHLAYQTWAGLPKSRAKKQRKSAAEVAAAHGLGAEEVGAIDAGRLVRFIWRLGGRAAGEEGGWQRERPLWIVLDNYSVHKSQAVVEAAPEWAAAGMHLVYLPSYCPEMSGIEPIWNDVKAHQLPIRSFAQVADLKHAVEAALARKAYQLYRAHAITTNTDRAAT